MSIIYEKATEQLWRSFSTSLPPGWRAYDDRIYCAATRDKRDEAVDFMKGVTP